jgi:flavin reductase (DIM6/NTAB) family NADH-FMN oxidoreductase RutF
MFAPSSASEDDDYAPRPELDPAELRRCVGRFATGVAVVSYMAPEGPWGITINSFTSVSLDPPLILVSVARTSRTHELLEGAPFVVNILAAEQMDVAASLARRGERPPIAWAGTDLPYLADSLALLRCEPADRVDAGDHSLFLGRVVDVAYRDGDALGFHKSQFLTIAEGEGGR